MAKLKLMTVLGTRPEIIRLAPTLRCADRYFDHILVHTGQNYDYTLNEVFFEDLELTRIDGKAAVVIGGKQFVLTEEQQVFTSSNVNSIATSPNKLFGVFVNRHTSHVDSHRTGIEDFNELLMVLAIQLIKNKIVVIHIRSWRSDAAFDYFVFRITGNFNKFIIFSFNMESYFCS